MEKMKNFAKKFFAIVATLVLAILPVANVNAAAQSIDLGPGTKTGSYVAGVQFHYKKTTDGRYLYCVDMKKNTSQNITADLVTRGSVVDGGMVYILKNGFPEKSITSDTDKDYYITQTAIWWYLDETTGSHNLGEYFKETGSDIYNLRPIIKNLVNEGIKHKNDSHGIKEYTFKMETSSAEMTLKGDYYVSQNITVSNDTNLKEYKISLSGAPAGTLIEIDGNSTNATSAKVVNNQSVVIKVPASVATNDLSIKVTGEAVSPVQYDAYEYTPRDSSMQNVALLEKVQKKYNSEVSLHISLATKVSIIKVDAETKKPLAGAVLVLKDANGKEVTRWTSSTKVHVIQNLAFGKYTVEEVSAPEGYLFNKEAKEFVLSERSKDVKVQFENKPKNVVVNITKVDQATQQPLAGAVLVIKDAKGEVVYKFTSSDTSEVITDLENGTYTVEELSAPEGYIKSDKIVTFTIDDDHLSHQITFENAKETFVPDTGSVSSMIMIILGIVITGLGLKFVYKNGQRAR